MNAHKWSVAAIALCLGSMVCTARTIIIDKRDGGPNGFNRVWEYHDYKVDKHILYCRGAGYEACEWTHSPEIVRGYPRLIEYAEQRIAAGELSGSYSEEIDGVLCTVQWEAQDPYNATITLED